MAKEENNSYYSLLGEVRYELELDHNPIFDAIGEATIEIENGLVRSIHQMSIFQTDINADGSIDGSSLAKRAIEYFPFDLHKEVADCVHRLAQTGYIPLDYNCYVSEDKNPEYEATLSVKNWSGGPLLNDYLDLYPPLFDIKEADFSEALNGPLLKAVIYFEGAYSEEWYCALICRIYFTSSLDTDINNIALIGKLIEQMHWKTSHEEDALEGEASFKRRKKGTNTNSERKMKRKAYIVEKVSQWELENNEEYIFAKNNTIKARLLKAAGLLDRPELFKKANGSISLQTIKTDFEDCKSEILQKLTEKKLR